MCTHSVVQARPTYRTFLLCSLEVQFAPGNEKGSYLLVSVWILVLRCVSNKLTNVRDVILDKCLFPFGSHFLCTYTL